MRLHRFVLSPLAAFVIAAIVPSLLNGRRSGSLYLAGPVSIVQDNSAVPAPRVASVVKDTIGVMQTRLRTTLSRNDVTVQVCPNDSIYRAAGGLGNTDACYLAPYKIVLRRSRHMRSDLAHEFAHVLIEDETKGSCPVWFEEGIINHENHVTAGGQYTVGLQGRLAGALRTMKTTRSSWSLEGLSDHAERSRIMDDAFYGACWSASDYMYRTYGRAAILLSLSLMADHDADTAFRMVFGKPVADVEADWKSSLI